MRTIETRTTCYVPTDVMAPTLNRGDEIVVDLGYYYRHEPRRWEIAVFYAPEIERMYDRLGFDKIEASACGAIVNAAADIRTESEVVLRPHIMYIKRIVGLPGERMAFTEDAIMCDGKRLDLPRDLRKCYASFDGHKKFKYGAKEHEVPDDCVFALSDSVQTGKDSREVGPIPIKNLVALVVR